MGGPMRRATRWIRCMCWGSPTRLVRNLEAQARRDGHEVLAVVDGPDAHVTDAVSSARSGLAIAEPSLLLDAEDQRQAGGSARRARTGRCVVRAGTRLSNPERRCVKLRI